MKRLSMMVLWIVIGWAFAAGCAVAPESAEPVPLQPQSGGDGTCGGGNSQCWVDRGVGGIVYGTCTAGGTCCTGCIDGRGNCQTGLAISACGKGGGACAGCTATPAECYQDACLKGVCGFTYADDASICGVGTICNGLGVCGAAACMVDLDCAPPPFCYSVRCVDTMGPAYHTCGYFPQSGPNCP